MKLVKIIILLIFIFVLGCTDGKCSIACGIGEKRFKREVIQKTILGFTTAFVLWQTGIAINGETWWSDGSKNINILTEAGYIKTRIP